MKSSSQPTPGAIFSLVRTGVAASRADLSRVTGLAASTITTRVEELIAAGYLAESGEGASQGGRRPRALVVPQEGSVVAGVDLGARHASVGLYSLSGELLHSAESELLIAQDPEIVLAEVHRRVLELMSAEGHDAGDLAAVGLSLPGPVDARTREVISPSRMPGWSGVDAGALMERISGVAAGVENDANAMTLGEHVVLGRPAEHMVLVKAGSSIGCGVLADGRLHRGSRGMAGDVSHAAVVDAPNVLCSCGRLGCLDAVAGGAAIVSALRAMGLEVGGTADVIEMARNAHPPTMRLLREAGARTGSVLATIVNFFNPDRLVIAGSLSGAEAFVAGVRSTIYDLCPPMLTDGLRISVSEAAARGASIGAAAAVLDHMLDAEAVDAALRAGRPLRGTRLI